MEWLEILTPWHWLTAAVVIIVLEMLIGTYYLLWVGFAAALTSLIQWAFGIGWQAQIVVFFLMSMGSILGWYFYSKNNPEVDTMPNLNKRGQQYIGRTFNLTHPIVNGVGKIKVDDSTWKVKGPDLEIGTKVKVVDIQGTIFNVIETK